LFPNQFFFHYFSFYFFSKVSHKPEEMVAAFETKIALEARKHAPAKEAQGQREREGERERERERYYIQPPHKGSTRSARVLLRLY
jgi:septal ring factor EnvC (AmiA/AmiB activator)